MKEALTPAQIEAARRGSEVELAAVIARFMPVIRHGARRAAGPGLDFDDAVQEGLIGLFSALQSWREDQRAAFATYAGVCVRNAILSAQKTAGRKKHAPLNQSVPLPDAPGGPGPEEQAIANEQAGLVMEKARTLLSPLEKRVLRGHLEGAANATIAAALGKSAKSVENALSRIRAKLR